MRKELVKTWLKDYPVLKEFDSKRAPDSPNPLIMLELIPDSFGEKFITKPLSNQFEVKPLEIIHSLNEFITPHCTLYENQIHVTNHAYHHFLRALGLYAWKYLLSIEDRKNYATIVKALNSNHLFQKEKKESVSPENSTWLHFARNVQNVIAMRPLEFVQHRKGAARTLLAFFKEIGVIDERHHDLYLKKLGSKRAFEAKTKEETSASIKNGITKKHAQEAWEYVKKSS